MSGIERFDRLLAAAVTEFCSLMRPGKGDAQQLAELALPLLRLASPQAKRHAAAALSETSAAPKSLVLALCDEPVDICAPLLVRSLVLSSADLLGKLSQHGDAHARAIARRKRLSTIVLQTLKRYENPAVNRALELRERLEREFGASRPVQGEIVGSGSPAPMDGASVEDARDALRAIMSAAAADAKSDTPSDLPAPSGRAPVTGEEWVRLARLPAKAFFQTALADALHLRFETARSVCENIGSTDILAALRTIGLPGDEAIGVYEALAPVAAENPDALLRIRSIYERIDMSDARRIVRGWRTEDLLAIAQDVAAAPAASNDSVAPDRAAAVVATPKAA